MALLPNSLLQFLYFFLKKYKFSFCFFFIAPIGIILEANMMPYALKIMVDTLVSRSTNRDNIFTDLLPALLLFIFSHITFIIIVRAMRHLEAKIIPNIEADIKSTALNYVMSHPYKFFASKLVGNIASQIGELPQAIEQIRTIVCWNIIPSIAVVICTLIMTLLISSLYSLILGSWIIVHILISIYFSKKIGLLAQDNAEAKWHLNGSILDVLSNIITVKVFNRYLHESHYINYLQLQEKITNTRLIKITNYLQIIIDIPLAVMLAGIVYFLIVDWQRRVITTGECIFIVNTTFSVLHQLWSISQVLTNLFRQIGIAKKALDTILIRKEVSLSRNNVPLEITRGEIEFKNVYFSYPNGNCIFNNFNIILKPKQKVGVVGLSGSGKSTFLNLLLQLFDIDSGLITIDGQNIHKVCSSSLYSSISVVPADTKLFYRTIMDNIRYGRIDASDEEVIDAAKKAHADEFITKMPGGYFAYIGGAKSLYLSSGQKQRILIARAFLKNAPIVLMDEPTSALDSVTENLIQSTMHDLIKDRTAIITTHRLSTLYKMDRILVFKEGKIIEDGTHPELIRTNSHYAHLFRVFRGHSH